MPPEGTDPTSIGPFVVLRKIGEGSMGVVYAGYDVGLDRKVALKLVQSKLVGKRKIRERMLREAQALARLSSAYVVQVYQVGEHGDGIYLAMEYVDGEDLRQWFKRDDVGWRELLRALCDAGRGLAAAHAAGLVHRDFKPENVLLGVDGRARVLDFGLVINEGEDDFEEPGETPTVGAAADNMPLFSTMPAAATEKAPSSSSSTASAAQSSARPRLRRVAGTPAYMSPEQHFGGVVGPYSDQFSFAITLYEALYGYRPFEGASWKEIREKVQRSLVPAPPADSPVPRWIHRIILRGLALDPEDRWPSIEAMVTALERDPRRSRLRVLGVAGAVVAASAASYGIAVTQLAESRVCEGLEVELDGVWDEPRRAEVRRAFAATGVPYAEDTWRLVLGRLDAYSSTWVEGRTLACEANVNGSLSERLIEGRLACVERRKGALRAITEMLSEADRDVVENAVQAVSSLPSVATCANVERLIAEASVPDDPSTAKRVEALRKELSSAAVLESAGRYEESAAIIDRVRREASGIGFGPLEAEAALRDGSLRIASGRSGDARGALTEALEKAIVYDLDAWAADAAAKRIFAIGEGERSFSEALGGAAVARALAAKVRGDWRLAALLNNNLGAVYLTSRDFENAAIHFERTIALVPADEREREHLVGVSHHNLGEASVGRGDLEAAKRHYGEAVARMRESLGEHHPMIAHPLAGLGDVEFRQGRLEEARVHYDQALVQMESAYGDETIYLVQPLTGLGEIALRRRQYDVAERYFRRVVALSDALGVQLDYLATALEGLGSVSLARGEPAAALPSLERAVSVREGVGASPEEIAAAALRAGKAAAEAGDETSALRFFELVLAVEQTEDELHSRLSASVKIATLLAEDPSSGARERACHLVEGIQRSVDGEFDYEQVARLRMRVCE